VEADILSALDQGTPLGASLDVFETEPLARMSPIWEQPRAVTTPRNASISEGEPVAANVFDQISAHGRGDPLVNLVDRKRGY